jgi:hypothetical protein
LAKFKGTVFLSTRIFTENTFGEAAVKKCLESLQSEEQRMLEGVTAVGWYPVEPVLKYHRALDSLYGNGDLELCVKVGEFSAVWSANTILKFFLRLKSPLWILEKHQSVWSRYHDSGRWEISRLGERAAMGKLLNFDVADEVFCARFRGWLQGAVRLTGGKGAKVEEIRCKARGASHCEFKISWEQ